MPWGIIYSRKLLTSVDVQWEPIRVSTDSDKEYSENCDRSLWEKEEDAATRIYSATLFRKSPWLGNFKSPYKRGLISC